MRQQCVSCFHDDFIYCDNPCCKGKAYNFFLRTGAKLPNAGGANKITNKESREREKLDH